MRPPLTHLPEHDLDAWIDERAQLLVFRMRALEPGQPAMKISVALEQIPRLMAQEIIRRISMAYSPAH